MGWGTLFPNVESNITAAQPWCSRRKRVLHSAPFSTPNSTAKPLGPRGLEGGDLVL